MRYQQYSEHNCEASLPTCFLLKFLQKFEMPNICQSLCFRPLQEPSVELGSGPCAEERPVIFLKFCRGSIQYWSIFLGPSSNVVTGAKFLSRPSRAPARNFFSSNLEPQMPIAGGGGQGPDCDHDPTAGETHPSAGPLDRLPSKRCPLCQGGAVSELINTHFSYYFQIPVHCTPPPSQCDTTALARSVLMPAD